MKCDVALGPVVHLCSTSVVDWQAFYRKHAPDLVTSANKILNKFKGREAELFAKVVAKYGADPSELVVA